MTIKIKKCRTIECEAEGKWFDIYRTHGLKGNAIEVEVPRGITSEKLLLQRLLEGGAALKDDSACLTAIKEAMNQVAPTFTRASQVGWRDNNSGFVTRHGAVGIADKLIPPRPKKKLAVILKPIGTLEGWQDLIKIARHSTTMTLALCAVFASLLLHLLAKPSFALVFVSASRSGKSTVQLVAGSVLGFKNEKDLPTFDATEAGLRELAVLFNDHPLILNEVATADGKKGDVYASLLRIAYALLSGRDIERHSSWNEGQDSHTFSTIALISSEVSPAVWAERAKEERDPGESVRLITVPVSLGERTKTFDQPPEDKTTDELTAWSREQADILAKGLRNHSGVAWAAYLEQLVENRVTFIKQAERVISLFEAKMAERVDNDIKRDIVSKFGIITAGGILAVEAGILPLDKSVVAQAIVRSCNDALDALPDPESDLRQDKATLCEMLKGPTIIELPELSASPSAQKRALIGNAEGFRRKGATGIEFLIRSESFSAWFKTGERTRKLLEYLDTEGLLDRDRPYRPGRSIEWAQNQSTWPDGTRPRSIRLLLPRGLTDLRR